VLQTKEESSFRNDQIEIEFRIKEIYRFVFSLIFLFLSSGVGLSQIQMFSSGKQTGKF
jgi:hypothetical protein